ncbi:MAG: DnaA regulatory inactivator Hda [Woeseiaceae bacterium]|nr:DnaA regulatory inactivator Hda [Woeseiaceae bacterium]
MSQLALPLKLQDHAVFESFLPTGNEALIAFLQDLVNDGHGLGGWLRGGAAVGKTHLLQAFCERVQSSAQYLPMGDVVTAGAEILDGLASRQFVCLDDVDIVAGNDQWELGLFRLFNDVVDAGGTLLCSASAAPRDCGFELADLESRFSLLPVYQIHPLGDSERIEALQLRAGHRGLELPVEAAAYLLNRSSRDMASLYQILDKLDSEALIAQRRLTIPFVREVIGKL